jgi:deoxyribodipyrimidine photo-lyase
MNELFPADFQALLLRIDQIDPVQYGKTRNYIHGDVTHLSPYISRGVISTKQVLSRVLEKGYKIEHIEPFVKELCWRDYFQRVGQIKDLSTEIRQRQDAIRHHEIPTQVVNATTGIQGIDNGIAHLYRTGYMHNHCRMYTASLVCNVAGSHWLLPAQWMYYHLLDGDWASNACSWQWVAGAFSNKRYFANQENINRFTSTHQTATFLDKSYEELERLEIPDQLIVTQKIKLETAFPESDALRVDPHLPSFIYNYYNLDPLWRAEETGNRILLIEPRHFNTYPISEMCMNFMLAMSKHIPNLQVHVGSFESLAREYGLKNVCFKEHPLNIGYVGTEDPRDWIAHEVAEYYPSFFGYWKRIQKHLSAQ